MSKNKHGMTGTPEFYSWQDIKKRCQGLTEKHKRDYVDRGITVHEDFKNSFETFLKEIGLRPTDEPYWSVGRIDNNLGYTYGNMRWERPSQQARNRTKRVDNKTGITGVIHDKSNNCIIASSKNLDGTQNRVRFSLLKYSYEEAIYLATEVRKSMIDALNKQGADYGKSHGKDK